LTKKTAPRRTDISNKSGGQEKSVSESFTKYVEGEKIEEGRGGISSGKAKKLTKQESERMRR